MIKETVHTRWEEAHRKECDSCNDAYQDELSQPEYEEDDRDEC